MREYIPNIKILKAILEKASRVKLEVMWLLCFHHSKKEIVEWFESGLQKKLG